MVESINTVLKDFTEWHNMESLEITASDPPELKEALNL
jgi:hypothetical protein